MAGVLRVDEGRVQGESSTHAQREDKEEPERGLGLRAQGQSRRQASGFRKAAEGDVIRRTTRNSVGVEGIAVFGR